MTAQNVLIALNLVVRLYLMTIACCSLIILLPTRLEAQSGFRFTVENVASGLSQNTVNAVLHDQNGLYWFATQDGLNRFTGENYRARKGLYH